MTTFVLVGGAWLGGWAWRDVAHRLRTLGHDPVPVTLTGLGDRAHLARPDIDLDTHVEDIVATVEVADLPSVVLVGHSYGSAPVTGAAARLTDRLSRLVYVDGAPIPGGASYLDGSPPAAVSLVSRLVAERGGWRLPMPAWDDLESVFGANTTGLGDADRARIRANAVDHPFASYTQPLRLAAPLSPDLPKTAILNSFGTAELDDLIASGHPWGAGMSGPEWTFVELSTGHWPMFSRPDDLADALAALPTR